MGCLKEFYKSVFQNPELFLTQVSLSPEKSTLAVVIGYDLTKKSYNIISPVPWPVYCGHEDLAVVIGYLS
jgi:hypothetical protein